MEKRYPQNPDGETGSQLKDLLNEWQVPPASDDLDRRTIAAFRTATLRQPLWRRLFTFRIPLPVAFACCALLVAITAIGMHGRVSLSVPVVEVRTVTEVKTIEVPVVQKEIVTHIIYRDRKPAQVALSTPKLDDQKLAVANEANGNGYLTNTELTGFQPNADMTLKVIKRNVQNEK